MDYVLIGKIVNTHGIKGEIRIISDFEFKDKVFVPGFNIYIGKDKIKETITSYRHHKIYEMITMDGYKDINEVIKYLKENVYILKKDLKLNDNEYLDKDLIDFKVYESDNLIGVVSNITYASETNKLLEVLNNDKKILIPFNDEFVININLQEKRIDVKLIKGMI